MPILRGDVPPRVGALAYRRNIGPLTSEVSSEPKTFHSIPNEKGQNTSENVDDESNVQ